MVGLFPKPKVFFLPLPEIRTAIEAAVRIAARDWHEDWFPPLHRNIGIYGGEPTVHPEWTSILSMLIEDFRDIPFVVLTNGRNMVGDLPQSGDDRFDYLKTRRDIKAHHRNVFWRIDPKDAGRQFIPTLVAPQDIVGDADFYAMAQENCVHWDRCETILYRGKGYFCVNAGPMDWLFHDGSNGWDITDHTFDRTDAEIEAQARLFCHRCHYALPPAMRQSQPIDEPSQVSLTNRGAVL